MRNDRLLCETGRERVRRGQVSAAACRRGSAGGPSVTAGRVSGTPSPRKAFTCNSSAAEVLRGRLRFHHAPVIGQALGGDYQPKAAVL